MQRSALSWFAFVAVGAACSLATNLDGLSGEQAAQTPAVTPTTDAGDEAQRIPIQGWRFSKLLTIDKGNVTGSSDLSDFPVLVSTTDGDLKTVENGGKVVNGFDIAFFDADGVRPLAHEIEQYSPATAQLTP